MFKETKQRTKLDFIIKNTSFENDSYEKIRDINEYLFVNPKNAGKINTPLLLVREMISKLPEDAFQVGKKVLDPACKNGIFLKVIHMIRQQLGQTEEEIQNDLYGFEPDPVLVSLAKHITGLKNIYIKDFIKEEISMKFDLIVGNPPYQDGNQEGGQNKIYNLFCKKSLELLNPDGVLTFVTPSSVLKRSKRFSLIGQKGLKCVDFAADRYFDVGQKIIFWLIDKTYTGDVNVVMSNNNIERVLVGNTIYDTSEVDVGDIEIYESIINYTSATKDKDKRMFQRYTHAGAFSKTANEKFQYPIVSNNKGVEKILYGKTKPTNENIEKMYISNTKALTEESLFVDTRTYGPSFFYTTFDIESEIENIKSFVCSDYFRRLSIKFRVIRGGMNSVLIDYCPIFDKTKKWTNDEVKEFFEGFLFNA